MVNTQRCLLGPKRLIRVSLNMYMCFKFKTKLKMGTYRCSLTTQAKHYLTKSNAWDECGDRAPGQVQQPEE